jgi:hypothetical protein
MKLLARLITALSLAGSCFAGVALAQTEDGADAAGGAKGLFFEQLSHPADNLNTGIQYWIELHHDGQVIHATNKTAFHTGDKIRFHVRPNIDGFAYIMLKSGSRGEQAVLFPSKGRDENNKITRGKEIVLPDDGMLSFDANPGTEKLTLLVSRKPIDTESYLFAATATASGPPPDADTNSKAPTEASSKEPQVAMAEPPRLVAMASSGSKDLIPNQVLVAYLPSSSGVPESVKAAAAKASKQAASTGSKQQEASNQKGSSGSSGSGSNSNSSSSNSKLSSKTSSTTKSGSSSSSSSTSLSGSSLASTSSATEDSKVKTSRGSHKGTANKGSKHQSVATANTHTTGSGAQSEKAALNAQLVTVVFKNPDSVLAADISLEHL